MFDIIIIGAGPAGLCAAVYAKRAGHTVEIFEGYVPGGQVITTAQVENYLGFENIDGVELAMKFSEHANKLGININYTNITKVNFTDGNEKLVYCGEKVYVSKTVIIASGAKRRLLNVKGENEYTGKGVSYCANCDGNFFKNKVTAVVGGGNTAVEDAIYLARLCKKVYVIHRRDKFRASKILIDRLTSLENVEMLYNSKVNEICGDSTVNAIVVENTKYDVDGVFVAIGTIPESAFITDDINKDDEGYIITDEYCMTNVNGVFAAGDVRKKILRQIITAVSDGAIAAYGASMYMEENNR